jgi:hypothetical protein
MNKVAGLGDDKWAYGGIIVNHIGTTGETGDWTFSDQYVPGGGEYSLMVFLNSTSSEVG